MRKLLAVISLFVILQVPTVSISAAQSACAERDASNSTIIVAEQSAIEQPKTKFKQTASSFSDLLAKCPKATRTEFLEGLVFMNGGLAGAYIGGVEKCLSPQEMGQLFSHFGVTEKSLKDHQGYRCSGRATCSPSATNICTSNCRSD
jgi:hypothetical protein